MKKLLTILPAVFIAFLAVGFTPHQAHAAIAFNAATRNAAVTTVTDSFTHVNSGSNVSAILYFYDNSTGATKTVTYGGVTMTQACKVQMSGSFFLYGFFLGSGVPTGSQTVSITDGSSRNYSAVSIGTYTGTSQASATTPDSVNTKVNTTSGNDSVSTTVVAANSWVTAGHVDNDADPDGTISPAVERTQLGGPSDIIDTNGPVAAGSQSIGWHWALSDLHALCAISIAPAAASPKLWQFFGW